MTKDFKVSQKASSAPIPKDSIAIVVSPSKVGKDYTYFDVEFFHNFERKADSLTTANKTLYLIGQGLLEISMHDSEYVMDRGLEVMKQFMKGLGEPEEVDLATITPKGNA